MWGAGQTVSLEIWSFRDPWKFYEKYWAWNLEDTALKDIWRWKVPDCSLYQTFVWVPEETELWVNDSEPHRHVNKGTLCECDYDGELQTG